MNEGWKCPHCGSAHAPDVKTCPVIWKPLGWPAWPDCGCPSNHVCMSVACPRAVRITCAVRHPGGWVS